MHTLVSFLRWVCVWYPKGRPFTDEELLVHLRTLDCERELLRRWRNTR